MAITTGIIPTKVIHFALAVELPKVLLLIKAPQVNRTVQWIHEIVDMLRPRVRGLTNSDTSVRIVVT